MLQNRYRIVGALGEGGMGAVYRAWDTRLDVPLAIKEMMAQPGLSAEMFRRLRQQFIQEAKVLARLDHPHLVDVTDYFEEGGQTYLVMKFVEGESLADRIAREGAQDEVHVRRWAVHLLDALAYCHAQGILHRDVKPQNVVITPKGKAMLVDFGLVKLWDANDPRTRTVIRGAGTPEYSPPEQYSQHTGHTEPRSDIYSLGATLYYALTGQTPPRATDRMAYPQSFQSPRVLNGRISQQMDDVVQRAMALPCDQRWPSAAAMAAALTGSKGSTRIVSRPPTPASPRSPQPQTSWWRRVPVWGWALAAVLLLSAGLAAGSGFLDGEDSPAATEAPPTLTLTSTPSPKPTPTRTRPTSIPELTPTATPRFALHDTWTRPADEMTMVYVPGGSFQMGSNSDEADSDEQPVHEVTLDGFWMDQTEVTNAQFATFLNEEGNQTEGGETWLDIEDEDCLIEESGGEFQPKSGYVEHPVIEVSWYGAAAYCEWAGGRLPTEAEWEYAARGEQGHIYPWGDEFDCSRGNFDDETEIDSYVVPGGEGCDGYIRTAPVGSFPEGASWCDALDMAGNVWEWVADWYEEDYYERSPVENPTGPESGEYRVLRGGSWYDLDWFVRAASRGWLHPAITYNYNGFRCVAVTPQGS